MQVNYTKYAYIIGDKLCINMVETSLLQGEKFTFYTHINYT